jgi:hypothetical protein
MLGRSFATPLFGGEPSNALALFTTVAWVAMLLSLIGLATCSGGRGPARRHQSSEVLLGDEAGLHSPWKSPAFGMLIFSYSPLLSGVSCGAALIAGSPPAVSKEGLSEACRILSCMFSFRLFERCWMVSIMRLYISDGFSCA